MPVPPLGIAQGHHLESIDEYYDVSNTVYRTVFTPSDPKVEGISGVRDDLA